MGQKYRVQKKRFGKRQKIDPSTDPENPVGVGIFDLLEERQELLSEMEKSGFEGGRKGGSLESWKVVFLRVNVMSGV